jgi:hypothetical protein
MDWSRLTRDPGLPPSWYKLAAITFYIKAAILGCIAIIGFYTPVETSLKIFVAVSAVFFSWLCLFRAWRFSARGREVDAAERVDDGMKQRILERPSRFWIGTMISGIAALIYLILVSAGLFRK